MLSYDSVKVFSATKARDRESLGNVVTDWIRAQQPVIKETLVKQSSDREFHCLTIVVFYDQETK